MSKRRTDDCIGFLTGKCPYTGGADCSQRKLEECFPPICLSMTFEDGKIFCKEREEYVDPQVCLHCNPKENL